MEETCIRFGQHGARVMIEEKEIPHYAIHVDPVKKEVSCWIASEAGKAFSVIWLELDVDYPTACDLYLDGHPARFCRRRSVAPKVLKHAPVSKSSLGRLLFSPLAVTDDDTYLDNSPSHSIGEIKFVISRTAVFEKIKKKRPTTYAAPPHLKMVHERSKKAIAHRVDYGTEIPRIKGTHSAKRLETLVTFIFKYRPLEMLHANDIVTRNPELLEYSKLKKEAESDDDSDEDSMREKALLAEVQRCQAEVEKIRKARKRHSKDSERPKKKLEKEEKPFFTPGEIIDLT